MKKLRPEFQLLDDQFMQLYYNIDVDKEFLKKVRGNIELCEHVAELDEEKSILTRTTYWWRKRASLFGMDMTPKLLENSISKEEIATKDRLFLRSLRIAWDEPVKDDQPKDDGA